MRYYKITLFSLSLLIVFLLGANPSKAENDLWEKLAARPDVEIVMHDGLRSVRFASGVVAMEAKNGGVAWVDETGLGAVQCAWRMYSHIRLQSEQCYDDSRVNLKTALKDAVDRIEVFIVENSLTPVTKLDLEAAAFEAFNKVKYRSKDEMCSDGFAPHLLPNQDDEFILNLTQGVDELLSVPRPPVMNPCL